MNSHTSVFRQYQKNIGFSILHLSTSSVASSNKCVKLKLISLFIFLSKHKALYKRLCIKTGIQERGTECGERGEWGGMLYSGECHQTFRGMSPNILGNVAKYSGECRKTFRGMSSNIPGNVAKHSGECPQIFRGMSPNLPGNAPLPQCFYTLVL